MSLEPIDEARGRLERLLSKHVAAHRRFDLFLLHSLGTRQPKQNVARGMCRRVEAQAVGCSLAASSLLLRNETRPDLLGVTAVEFVVLCELLVHLYHHFHIPVPAQVNKHSSMVSEGYNGM